MSQQVDLSFLDRPEILEIIFPVAYSYFPELEIKPLSGLMSKTSKIP